MKYVERKISTEDLISFDEIAKKHIAGEYEPSGVMFFCIPASVKILGYLEVI